MGKYYIKFDRTNSNNIVLTQDKEQPIIIACPANDKNCDIINLSKYTSSKGHILTFPNVLLITDSELRQLYYKGKVIDIIHNG